MFLHEIASRNSCIRLEKWKTTNNRIVEGTGTVFLSCYDTVIMEKVFINVTLQDDILETNYIINISYQAKNAIFDDLKDKLIRCTPFQRQYKLK